MALIWPKTGFASIAYAATASVNFLPLGCAHSSREPRKPPATVLRCAAALPGAASIAFGLSIAIEAAMGAAR
jgi:hypothetical protein